VLVKSDAQPGTGALLRPVFLFLCLLFSSTSFAGYRFSNWGDNLCFNEPGGTNTLRTQACKTISGNGSSTWNTNGYCTIVIKALVACTCTNTVGTSQYCGALAEGGEYYDPTGPAAGAGSLRCKTDWTGTYPNCVPPVCPTGKVYDVPTGQCVIPDTTPESCADGEMASVDSTGAVLGCTELADLNDDENCQNPQGYINGELICGDAAAACEGTGGSYGVVNGSEVCVPHDYSPPICEIGTVLVIDEGYVCSVPDNTADQDPNTVGDGPADEGVCDTETTDCDGDGNVDDSDADGTVDNGAGATAGQDGTENDSAANGAAVASGSCLTAPACSGGDPQLCALLRQQWETMCASARLLERADDNQAGVLKKQVTDAIDAAHTAIDTDSIVDAGQGNSGIGPVGDAAEQSYFTGMVAGLLPSGVSCSTYTMVMPGASLVFPCDRFNWLKSFFAWALYVMTALYVFHLVFRQGGTR